MHYCVKFSANGPHTSNLATDHKLLARHCVEKLEMRWALCEIKAVASLLKGSGKRLPSLNLARPQSTLQISCDEKEFSLPGATLATCRRMEDASSPLALTLPKAHTTLVMLRDASRCQASHELLEASVGE